MLQRRLAWPQDTEKLRYKNELCDVVIVSSDGQQTLAHSCILACHSSVLAAVLQSRLTAEHDWSVLRPLVINIGEVSVKNSVSEESEGNINVIETLISLMYGEIVNIADVHVPALNEYAHVLGLSDQIFTCLDGTEGKDTKEIKIEENISEECGQTVLDSCHKNNSNEYEHVEALSEINLDNQIFPTSISKSPQGKQSVDDSVADSFAVKDNSENVLSFSMLCSEGQEDDDSCSKAWHDGHIPYDKHGVQSESCNIVVCKMDQNDPEKSGREEIKHGEGSGILNITVNEQSHTNSFSGDSQQLHQQKRQAKKSFNCLLCNSAFQKCGDLVKHVQSMQHFTVQCPLCFVQVKEFEGQRLHFALHDQELPFFCIYCELRFRTRAALTMHTPKHMTMKPFVCNDCGRGFKWRHALHAHLHTHSPTSRLLCDICGFSSKYVTSFKAHLLQHSGQSFPCPHPGCSFSSNRKTHLNDHLATHSKTRVHQCEVCGHSFSHAKNMHRHMRLHAPASNLLTCISLSKLQCSFRTTRPDKLRDHLLRKHNMKHDSSLSKRIPRVLKQSNAIFTDHPSSCKKLPNIEYPGKNSIVQVPSPRTYQSCVTSKSENLPAIGNCDSVEVEGFSVERTNVSSQAQHDLSDLKKFNEDSKLAVVNNIKSDKKIMFQSSHNLVKDLSNDESEEHFSVLITSSDMVELSEIQTLQSHPEQSEKEQEVSVITDSFHSGFLLEHGMLLDKTESSGVSETCVSTKDEIHVLQTSVLPTPTQKVLSVSSSVNSEPLNVIESHSVSSLPYSSHCPLSESQGDIALEVASSSQVELSTASTVQASGSSSVGDSNFQNGNGKEEQCMESLTILDFMLDNVTS
ncbi:zinc finger protein 76-like [Macrobrachium nipponense]|uniref:zinc finger protein 76-like n=1 Tax=Macrobrachium nipponense TaxID=159736 RepID=UPI0030C86C15